MRQLPVEQFSDHIWTGKGGAIHGARCPYCNSLETNYRKTTRDWLCQMCRGVFRTDVRLDGKTVKRERGFAQTRVIKPSDAPTILKAVRQRRGWTIYEEPTREVPA